MRCRLPRCCRRRPGCSLLVSAAAIVMLACQGDPSPGQPAGGNHPPDKHGVKLCNTVVRAGPWFYRRGGPSGQIRASVHSECDPPPVLHHHLQLWLERDVTASGNWLLQGNIVHESLVPDVAGFDREVTFPGCISGRWRVRARVDGVDPNGEQFRWDLPAAEARPTTIQCPGP